MGVGQDVVSFISTSVRY